MLAQVIIMTRQEIAAPGRAVAAFTRGCAYSVRRGVGMHVCDLTDVSLFLLFAQFPPLLSHPGRISSCRV